MFDGKAIEAELVRVGFSEILLRYLPTAYRILKPLHVYTGEYVPLACTACERDLLEDLYRSPQDSIVIYLKDEQGVVVDIAWAHKGPCDRIITTRAHVLGLHDTWDDLGDLAIPPLYLRHLLVLLNQLRAGGSPHHERAFEKHLRMMIALGQKVFREATEHDVERLNRILHLLDAFPPGLT